MTQEGRLVLPCPSMTVPRDRSPRDLPMLYEKADVSAAARALDRD